MYSRVRVKLRKDVLEIGSNENTFKEKSVSFRFLSELARREFMILYKPQSSEKIKNSQPEPKFY